VGIEENIHMPLRFALACLSVSFALAALGCKDKDVPTQPKDLTTALRDALARPADYASDADTAMILRVAARALGNDGKEQPSGTLSFESTTPVASGQWKIVASWRRETTFKLEPRQGVRQEVSWDADGATVGASMDLAGVTPELSDVPTRLRGAKDLVLSSADPLQQVLTLSGFPDRITVTDKSNGEYHAVVETAKAEFVVDASKLIRAHISK
jgi:hypothetical protein